MCDVSLFFLKKETIYFTHDHNLRSRIPVVKNIVASNGLFKWRITNI